MGGSRCRSADRLGAIRLAGFTPRRRFPVPGVISLLGLGGSIAMGLRNGTASRTQHTPRIVVGFLAVMALAAGLLPIAGAVAATDTEAPSVVVDVPAQAQVFDQTPVGLAGTAADDIGVTGVTVAIQDLDTKLWLQSDGSFGPWATRLRDADLSTPGGTGTAWTYSFDPGRDGTFGAQIQAGDAAGNLSTKVWQRFTIAGITPPPVTPGYVTLLFGRALWVQTDLDCQPKPGTVDLQGVADALQARGLSASGNVVVSRTNESTRRCWSKYTLHPSWQDLARLRDDYGWSFVSGGAKYRNITTLSPQEQFAESCGSLDAFLAHGHTRASGLFAYPNNKTTTQIQTDVVSNCFSFGRTYGSGVTQSPPQAPYFQSTHSVNGGKCHDASLPCYTMAVRNDRRYTSPETLISKAAVNPGQWATLQWYRMVTGTVQDGSNFQWDCRSSDWRQHWTSDPETYCFEDFLAVVDALPSDVVVTDPLTVAQAWGRAD